MEQINFNMTSLYTRIIKYLINGIVVGAVVYAIPKNKLSTVELLTIAISTAVIFSILDILLPNFIIQ